MQSFVFSDKTKEKQYKYGSNKKNIKIVNSQSYIKNDFFLLTNDELTLITEVLKCKKSDILNISALKKGMTNRSFLFSVQNKKYIIRVPGKGTEQLINRNHEAIIYKTISGYGICDDPIYINPINGYKITLFLENARVCNPKNKKDTKKCINKLKEFHSMKFQVDNTFDIYEQIDFYEKLRKGIPSIYQDYKDTKNKIFSLRKFIDKQPKDWCLSHIDAVPDNFLFYMTDQGEKLQLTDWEYSGMQDPHIDIAMFIIYSYYNKNEADWFIDTYFDKKCNPLIRAKIYCYIAVCGLLWSNWAEYKTSLGIEFDEYGLKQYNYAKNFYKYAKKEITQYSNLEE